MCGKKKELFPVLIDWVDSIFYPNFGIFNVKELENLVIDNFHSVIFLIKEENSSFYMAQEYYENSERWKHILVFSQQSINNVINLEKGPGKDQKIVWIKWLDGFFHDTFYDSEDLGEIELSKVNSIGWLVKESKTDYYIARTFLPKSEHFDKLYTIPKKIVESVFELKKIENINENEERS